MKTRLKNGTWGTSETPSFFLIKAMLCAFKLQNPKSPLELIERKHCPGITEQLGLEQDKEAAVYQQLAWGSNNQNINKLDSHRKKQYSRAVEAKMYAWPLYQGEVIL